MIYSLQLSMAILPNIQLTVLLIILYAANFSFKNSTLLIIVHMILHSLVWGISIYTPTMFIGWMVIPIGFKLFNIDNEYKASLLAVVFSFIYMWLFIPIVYLTTGNAVIGYIIADIPYEIIFVVVNFILTLNLFKPLNNSFEKIKSGIEI